ncbi:alginate lyase family protein [Clostridium sp. YIM B02551]|uniref:alginate lyase family protein n=1 Tax=Clostridium sp. YIM B02551 TaxID=2910679 RepID=UPI001EEB4A93|nr:alginate lyase family protein [Clostridium sp. YIM B02551]
MQKVEWIYNRIKAMSTEEILYRIYNVFKNKKNKIRYRNNYFISEFMINKKIDIDKIDYNLEQVFKYPNYVEFKSRNENNYEVFNEFINLDKSINWHMGMYSDWDKNEYSNDIEFKNNEIVGDIRYTWEVNRHQFMPNLALKYKTTENEYYFELLAKHFDDWINNNPFLKGINWSSPMEIAIRSYQWLIVFFLLKDQNKEEFREKLIKSIIFSIDYVSNNLSSYSSANNHLIIEAYICSIIGYVTKDVYKQQWFENGYRILEAQIPLQFHKDGVNKEQALHYQAFVIDALLQYNFFLRKIGRKSLNEDIIEKSLIFMGSLQVNKKNFEFGDSDDAKLISFSLKKSNYYEYVLELGSIYYDKKFILFNSILPEVLMISGISNIPKFEYSYDEYKIYNEGGYGIIKTEETSVLFDFGELGFGSLAAHGHADSLSFIYYYRNKPIFIDAGTYIYNIKPRMRDYFRGTSVHNTLYYQGNNQSEIKGPFLWGKKAQTELLNYKNNKEICSFIAEHSGYHPNIHRRNFRFIKYNETIVIEDFFDEIAEVNFVLSPESSISCIENDIYEITSGKEKIFFYSSDLIEINNIKVSDGFLRLCNSMIISVKHNFSANSSLSTVISPSIEYIKDYMKGEDSVENSKTV